MRKAIIAMGLAGLIPAVQAAAFLTLTPGTAGVLPPVTAATTGAGAAAWAAGGASAGVAIATDLDSSIGGFGYVVNDATGTIAATITPSLVLAYSSVLPVPGTLAVNTVYYLIADTAVLGVGDPAPIAPYLRTETFELFEVIPEPGTYALLAGLGLVGFAGYRRFRR
ncbi:MAG: PEP-CTERM sorting domain-containing protein [Verrucomicrobiales bacterium]|nr:PEP-CTERM sorting domain-containing protein [Verrucomicrobiales bacterium]